MTGQPKIGRRALLAGGTLAMAPLIAPGTIASAQIAGAPDASGAVTAITVKGDRLPLAVQAFSGVEAPMRP